MATMTKEAFLKCLAKSEVLDEDKIQQWLSRQGSNGPKDMALSLVREKLLTLWQAKMVLSGRHRLDIGSYRLLSRTSRNEFGDRFEAMHLQLGRKVSIQILPSELSKEQKLKDDFLAQSSKIAHLDHPNLVHVFDIDEESGRLFVVSEFVAGESLAELNDRSISETELANVLHGCFAGLEYAHNHEVVHGGIDAESILLTKSGDSKIQNLGLVSVRNALAGESREHSSNEDITSLVAVAKELASKVVPVDSSAWSSLKAVVAKFESDLPTAKTELADWVRDNDHSVHEADVANELDLSNELVGDSGENAEGGFDQPIEGGAASTLAKPEKKPVQQEPEPEEPEPVGFIGAMAQRSPLAMITAGALAIVLMIGGTIWASSQMLTAEEPQPKVASNDGGKTKTSAKPKKDRTRQQADEVIRPKFNLDDGRLSSDERLDSENVLDKDANAKRISEIFGEGEKPEAEPPATELVAEDAAAGVTPPDPADSQTGEAAAGVAMEEPQATDPPAEVEPQTAPPEPAPAATVAKAEPQEEKKAAEQPEKKPVDLPPGTNPFENFAKVTELPLSEDLNPMTIGDLVLSKKHLLGAELVTGPEIAKSKPMFSMARSANDKQTWEFSYKKKKRDDPVVVATLQKTDSQLLFKWMPTVAENEGANYLRNCILKLSTPDNSHWLTLRKPIKIEDFVLTADKTFVKTEVEIPWLPNRETIRVTAAPLKVRLSDHEPAVMDPMEVTRDESAKMFFDRDHSLMWIDISAEMKKSLRVGAALVVHPDPTQAPMSVNEPAMLGNMSAAFQAEGTQLQTRYDQIKDLKTDEAKSQGFKGGYEELKAAKSELKKNAKEMLSRGGKYYKFLEFLPEVLDKPIPVTITFEMGEHRTILAESVQQVTGK
jgi:serine/threonine protein kinase